MAIKKKTGVKTKELKVSASKKRNSKPDKLKKVTHAKQASARLSKKDRLKNLEIEKKPVKLGKTYLSARDLKFFKDLIVNQKNEILENARRLRESLVDENTGEYVGENSTFSMHMAEHGTDEM